ncbi:MAG: hypothetical protein IPL22_07965 [Bacteroidetes bacterium]|nr:hypothetical protein [Bacteroidota bacterium]
MIQEIFMCEGVIFFIDRNKEWFYVDADVTTALYSTKLTGSILMSGEEIFISQKLSSGANAYPDVGKFRTIYIKSF